MPFCRPGSPKHTVSETCPGITVTTHLSLLHHCMLISMTMLNHVVDSISEKRTRGALKSAVERSLREDSFVVLDSLNNIKGYRLDPPSTKGLFAEAWQQDLLQGLACF